MDHQRARVQVSEKKRRAKNAVANHHIGLDVRPCLQRLVDGLGVPQADLHVKIAEMRVAVGASTLVGNQADPFLITFRQPVLEPYGHGVIDEGALHALALGQVAGDVAEVARELFMDKEDVHGGIL